MAAVAPAASAATVARAVLHDTVGDEVGTASFVERQDGKVFIVVNLHG
jgi:hypothetical protein